MKKLLSTLLFVAAMPASELCADAYIEMTVGGGTMTMKQWYSGDKSRNEIPQLSGSDAGLMAGMGNLMGQPLAITRLDKGVEWIIAKPSKSYLENSVKVPYHAPDPTSFGNNNTLDALNPDEPDKAPKIEIKKAGSAKVAGFDTDGYELWMDGKLAARYWMAPNKGALKDAFAQRDAFEKKLNTMRYADWPKADREAMTGAANAMQGALLGQMSGAFKLFNTGLPDGLPLKIEFLDEESGQMMTAMEIKAVNTDKIDPSNFEIPAGFKKTTQEQVAADMMGMDPGAMQDLMKQLPQNLNDGGINPEELLKLQQKMAPPGGGQ